MAQKTAGVGPAPIRLPDSPPRDKNHSHRARRLSAGGKGRCGGGDKSDDPGPFIQSMFARQIMMKRYYVFSFALSLIYLAQAAIYFWRHDLWVGVSFYRCFWFFWRRMCFVQGQKINSKHDRTGGFILKNIQRHVGVEAHGGGHP